MTPNRGRSPEKRAERKRARGSILRTHLPVAGFFLVVVTILHARMLLGTGNSQGWMWEDFIEYFYPIRTFAAVGLAHGSLPLWDPFTFAGMPLLADVGSGLLYPPNLVLALFVRDGVLPYRVLEWQLALHLALAGFGAYLAAWRFLHRLLPSLLAGFVYMTCGFMLAQTIHLSVVQAACWLPFVFLVSWEAQRRRSISRALGAGFLLAMSFLAGHPQTTLFVGMCAGLVALYFAVFPTESTTLRGRLRPFLLLLVSVLFTLAVAAPQLLATRELLGRTVRQELSYQASTESSFSPSFLATLVLPNFFGQAKGADWSSYWGPGAYFYCWELAAFVGIVPLFLALVAGGTGRRDELRREVRFLWILALFGIILAMGKYGFLHPLLYYLVPLYRRFRIPGRAVLLFDFGIALLAAFGLARLLDGGAFAARPRWRRWWIVLGGSVLVSLSAGFLLLRSRLQEMPPMEPVQKAMADRALLQFVLAASGMAIALLLFTSGRARRAAALLTLAAALVDLTLFGWGYTAGRESPEAFFTAGRTGIIQGLLEEGKSEFFRVNTRPVENPSAMVLRRNQGPIFGIFTIEGYNQLKLAAFQDFKVPVDLRLDLLNVKYRSVIRPMRGEVALVANPGYLPRAFVVPHAQRVSDGEEALAVLNDPAFDPRREVVIQPAPGHARRDTEEVPGEGMPEGNASVAFRRYGPNEIDLEVDSPLAGTLVLSEIYYPAWKVTVNGESRSLLRADYCLRGVEIPAGKSEVVFRMSDAPLRHGLLVTVAALVGAGIIGVWERR